LTGVSSTIPVSHPQIYPYIPDSELSLDLDELLELLSELLELSEESELGDSLYSNELLAELVLNSSVFFMVNIKLPIATKIIV
jgi:hypothetical protein